jgi:hypothetical protein
MVKSTLLPETVPGGSFIHTTTLLAGYTATFGNELFFCTGGMPNVAGTATFYSFSSFRFLVGDPRGCTHLQPNPVDVDYNLSGAKILKAVDGNRGPGSDRLWILTNKTRVSSLND